MKAKNTCLEHIEMAAMHQELICHSPEHNHNANQRAVHSIDFSTSTVPESDQFPAFRSMYHGVMDVSINSNRPKPFLVRQTVWHLGRIAFMRTNFPGESNAHRQTHLKNCTLDHWYVNLPFRNQSGVERGDAEDTVPRIHCLAASFDRHINHDGMLSLFVPRNLLPSTAALDRTPDATLEGVLGKLLADYMFLLDGSLPHLLAEQVPFIMEATRNLVAACLAPSSDRVIEAGTTIDATFLARARRIIDSRLSERNLSSQTLCSMLGASRSRLYRIFQPFGGVACYIRKQRLLRTRNALSDISDTRSISHIAEQWGFMDASTYGRTFRREFGMSPKAARDMARTSGGCTVAQYCSTRHKEEPTLYNLLRALD